MTGVAGRWPKRSPTLTSPINEVLIRDYHTNVAVVVLVHNSRHPWRLLHF